MAARLTDKQKKKIIADYVNIGSYNAVAKIHGVSATTVRKLVLADAESVKKCEQKKEENTADILKYLESQKVKVCEIIGKGLDVLNNEEKLQNANPAQITTALGTLIDKFIVIKGANSGEKAEDDPLTKALREEAERMQNETD